MIKKVLQKHKNGCAVASIAMLAGISYEEAIKALHPNRKPYEKISANLFAIAAALSRLNIGIDFKTPWSKTLNIKDIDKPALLCIDLSDKARHNHAVVWDPETQKIINPDPNRKRSLPISYYQNRLNYAIVLK